MAKRKSMVQEHLEEMVNYGGIMMTRGDMILDLQETAKATGHPNPQLLVNAYLGGRAHRERMDKSPSHKELP